MSYCRAKETTPNLHFTFFRFANLSCCSFLLYLSKLNSKRNDLWQKAKALIADPTQDEWFENQVVGRDPLNNAMKNLSERAKLSQVYTNHCIRSNVVTKFDSEGFEPRHVMAVSSHKSENSTKGYASKCPERKKRKCLMLLHNRFKILLSHYSQ